jgi:hypothetical protein
MIWKIFAENVRVARVKFQAKRENQQQTRLSPKKTEVPSVTETRLLRTTLSTRLCVIMDNSNPDVAAGLIKGKTLREILRILRDSHYLFSTPYREFE